MVYLDTERVYIQFMISWNKVRVGTTFEETVGGRQSRVEVGPRCSVPSTFEYERLSTAAGS